MLGRAGHIQEAIELLEVACQKSGQDFSIWFDLAMAQARTGNWHQAETCLTACIALRNNVELAYFARGQARHELDQYAGAIADFSHFLTVRPQHPVVLLHRAISYKAAGQYQLAITDLDQIVESGHGGPQTFMIRSRVHAQLGNSLEARQDQARALNAAPKTELDWLVLGVERMRGEPKLAAKDFEQALRLNPRSYAARLNLAYLLSEKLDRVGEALTQLNQLIQDYPDDADAFAGRGILLARQGRFEAARSDARRVLQLRPRPRAILQTAGIFAMAAKSDPHLKERAIQLVREALRSDVELARPASRDDDLKNVWDSQNFQELCSAAKKLND